MDTQDGLRILEILTLGNDGFVLKMENHFLKQTPDFMSYNQTVVP